jgi:hypothetical protein
LFWNIEKEKESTVEVPKAIDSLQKAGGLPKRPKLEGIICHLCLGKLSSFTN